jgi:hypothetical protein
MFAGACMLAYLVTTDYYSKSVHAFSTTAALMFGTIILTAKFGICCAFNCCFSSTTAMFPPQFSVVAFGIVNFCARAITFVAPQIAELQSSLPMSIFVGLAVSSIFASD